MVDYLVNHPTKTTTMVVPFAATAAWLWRISHPYSREPLSKGPGEAAIEGFYLYMPTSQEIN
jgi:hypothetical protein